MTQHRRPCPSVGLGLEREWRRAAIKGALLVVGRSDRASERLLLIQAVSEGEGGEEGLEVSELRRASQFPADISCHGANE